jgi:membrane-bound metal-dependent hydrolase YbcI (DUF457 family)
LVVFSGKVHYSFAIMLWLLFAVGGTYLNPIMLLLGSLFPDADHRKAPMGKLIPLWIWFRHRGATHTLWFMLIPSSIIWISWNEWAAVGFMVGYLSHLALDACTPSGIKWI